MNAQEKAIVRKSRESIGAMIARFNPESATVTDLRAVMKMLAPLVTQASAAAVKPKTGKSTKAKSNPLYLSSAHKFGCVCSDSCKRYAADWYAAVTGGRMSENMANLGAKLESKESIAERLTNCACGHSEHKEDEIGNLMACKTPGCDCDHFHYEVASIPGADNLEPADETDHVDTSKWSAADRRELARVNADMAEADDIEAFGRDAYDS